MLVVPFPLVLFNLDGYGFGCGVALRARPRELVIRVRLVQA
jgi:hypothetical protein